MTNEMTAEEAVKQIKENCYFASISEKTKQALDKAIKALEQLQDVHDTCKNCIEFSEFKQQPCDNCISREYIEPIVEELENICINGDERVLSMLADIKNAPPVIPKYTDEEIDKIQELEQAYVDKMVELAVEETKRPKGKWIEIEIDAGEFIYKCSKCGMRVINPYKYCPMCGSYNGGGEDEG